MSLERLALSYLERGYTAAADAALITPDGNQFRRLIKHQGKVYLPEQIGWKIREVVEAASRRSKARCGPMPTTAAVEDH